MNKLIALGILLIAGMSFAQVVPDGSLDPNLARAYCQRMELLPQLRSAAASYSSNHTSEINSALSNIASAIPNLREDCMLNDRSSFNSEYREAFTPNVNIVKSLYFKSALEYMRANPGYTMADVMSQFNGILSDYQSCVNARPIELCQAIPA